MPCCSILFTDSEYTTLFETPSILSELQLKIDLFSVKVTIQRLNPAKLNRLIFSSTSKPSCCTPGPVASDLMIKAFPFDRPIQLIKWLPSILYKLHFFYHSIKSTPATNLCQNDKTTKETLGKAYNAQTKVIV